MASGTQASMAVEIQPLRAGAPEKPCGSRAPHTLDDRLPVAVSVLESHGH
jgi:hypothetical protein